MKAQKYHFAQPNPVGLKIIWQLNLMVINRLKLLGVVVVIFDDQIYEVDRF